MKLEKGQSFYENCMEEFEEYLDTIVYKLKHTNEEYSKILRDIELLKRDYENVRDVLENDVIQSLSTDEVKALITIEQLQARAESIINKDVFFYGGKEVINVFKLFEII